MPEINFNGVIIESGALHLGSENRAFRYGDGIFETIRMFNGQLPFLAQHFRRFSQGREILRLETAVNFDIAYFEQEIRKATGSLSNARIRFTLFRQDGGLYKPVTNKTFFIAESEALPKPYFEIQSTGITMGICPYPLVSYHHTSKYKTCNRLPSISAALYAQQNHQQDCIMLNNEGKVTEAVSGNIFMIKNKQLITPPISSGCIDGIMRRFVISMAEKAGFDVKEKNILPGELSDYQEVFMTNAIQGIKPVNQIENIYFEIDKSNVLLSALNEFVSK